MPKPRIEYMPNEDITLYVGGSVQGGTYRVRDDIGSSVGDRELNNAIVEVRDIRAGAGINYEIAPYLILEVEGGYIIDRRMHYHRADSLIDSEGSPYTSIGIKSRF